MSETPPIFCARCDREPEYLVAPDPWEVAGPDHWTCMDCGEAVGMAANAALNEEMCKLWNLS